MVDAALEPARNRLKDEASPYLQQHADNPVHWWPWTDEAFAEARRLDKPILLSIGYSACHWCHVMAHESFADEATAALMNALFVNIKVDREERPDVDHLYMNALHALGQQGGWPLTMFLTPDLRPFWGGTYFPLTPRYGQPGFSEVLRAVDDAYRHRRNDIARNVAALQTALSTPRNAGSGGDISVAAIRDLASRIAEAFDPVDGGLGSAPKFPQGPLLINLWSAGRLFGNDTARQRFIVSMERMVRGGLFDQLGGGFSRYSVDAQWLVPHFEKMLYDNAQFIDLLLLALSDRELPLFANALDLTIGWLEREMVTEDGGFASSLDADSPDDQGHPHEGLFYTWTPDEIEAVLGPEADVIFRFYGVTDDGNFEGRTILNTLHRRGFDEPTPPELGRLRQRLLDAREQRPRPHRDGKILADWNGLAIAAVAHAGLARNRPEWVALAERMYQGVRRKLVLPEGLRHAALGAFVSRIGYAADHAALGLAALSLQEATGRQAYMDEAVTLADQLLGAYRDTATGVLSMNAGEWAVPFAAPQPTHDDAQPNANAQAIELFVRLSAATGDARWLEEADRLIAAVLPAGERHPLAHGAFWNAVLFRLVRVDLTLAGATTEARNPLATEARATPHPLRTIANLDGGGPAHALVCDELSCSSPLPDPVALRERIEASLSRQATR